MDLTDDPLAGVDASELEADIDKAIDELFVKKTEGKEPSRAEEAPPEEPDKEPAEKPVEESVPAPPAEAADDPLAQLKESLLTLDWEITPESIQDFEKELQAVSDKHGDDRHCMAVIKMSLGVLTYLRAAKADAAPISVQFLHGATRGLDLFLRESEPTEAERSEVMDQLLGQFRRVKAEIQRMKPSAERPPAVEPEPAVEPPPDDEPILEEMVAEEPALEEIIEEEPILEEAAAEEPILAATPEDEPVLDELFGEEPVLEEALEEEPILEEAAAEEPTLAATPEEEPVLDELFGEEPVLEEALEEEPTLIAPAEEEPLLEEPPEEEPTLEALTAEEPTLAATSEEEPVLDELLEEELVAEDIPGAEPTPEAPPEEEPVFEELFDEEPVLEPAAEPAEMAPPPEMVPADTPASQQPFIQEARALSGQLSNALQVLDQETTTFFARILQAMAGKPALQKLERHFGSVHKTVGAKLTDAQELSGNLSAALSKLEQNLDQQQEGALAPKAQAAIDSQVTTIRNAVQSLSQAASNLQHSLAGKGVASEGIAFKDAQLETEEFSLDSDEFMESLDSEPVLDLVEEIPSESPGMTPDAQASIYLADVVNNTLGIPAEAVVNIYKVSKGKVKSLRKRGYLRLTDFKGAFRSIKRGITGPLANLKPKDLKKIQFPIITLGAEILGSDDTEAVAPVRGIVLLSTGERHGALLTDEVMQRTPYDVKGFRKAGVPGKVSGTATIEGDFEINVIDPNYVLS
ncbi:MAG: hypothetical protein LJE87_01335 [Deltaproteobacteria bacterium]|nr:hypothetical protein [Deltaproteobacteria bacterium]